jgi:hypothetical protein
MGKPVITSKSGVSAIAAHLIVLDSAATIPS